MALGFANLTCAIVAPAALAAFPGANGRIVFERGQPLFTVAPDGSGALALTGTGSPGQGVPRSLRTATWSRSDRGAGAPAYGIWTVNADGTGARQVTVDPAAVATNDTDPAWSPDGSQIAFVRSGDLYVMNADGSASTNLTSDASPQRWPTPTGRLRAMRSPSPPRTTSR